MVCEKFVCFFGIFIEEDLMCVWGDNRSFYGYEKWILFLLFYIVDNV